MDSASVDSPHDRGFPFRRQLFEDPHVLYHGSWSTWAGRIEQYGFVQGRLPFEWTDIATIFNANQAIGRGSMLRMFLGDDFPVQPPRRRLYFSANFWAARAYATDGGGEVIRQALEEAQQFERVCVDRSARSALIKHWEVGLRESPGDPLTQGALNVLRDEARMDALREAVCVTSTRLAAAREGGHPVVYAVRVDSTWFEASRWQQHLADWQLGIREANLPCSVQYIPADRLIGKAVYPNGTESDFVLSCATWDDVMAIAGGAS